jgi:hypothetical protein
MAIVIFNEGVPRDVFLIPSTRWNSPDGVFKDRDYDGKKSAPEWGLELSATQIPMLAEYVFSRAVQQF